MIPPDATHHDGRAYLRLDTDGWAVWVDGAWQHICDAAEEALTAAGHAVLNPARNGTIVGSNAWQQYMRLSIAQVLQAEAVALLPGWVNSRGALLERRIATALGLLVGAVADFLGGEPS